jgi:hypothetical protein
MWFDGGWRLIDSPGTGYERGAWQDAKDATGVVGRTDGCCNKGHAGAAMATTKHGRQLIVENLEKPQPRPARIAVAGVPLHMIQRGNA